MSAPYPFNGFTFADLSRLETLYRFDQQFLDFLAEQSPALKTDLLAYRHANCEFTPIEISTLLVACAPLLEIFIAQLFGLETALNKANQQTLNHNPIFEFKKWFVQRRARRRLNKVETLIPFADLQDWLVTEFEKYQINTADLEFAIAQLGQYYLSNTSDYKQEIEQLTQWCIHALREPDAQQFVQNWVSFHLPNQRNHDDLIHTIPVKHQSIDCLITDGQQQREGFNLTDSRMSARQVQSEVDYCVYCHEHDGDFCSKGFPEKKGELTLKIDPLGVTLTGCPLGEKISEMHLLKRQAHTIGALAMLMVDNPFCPATGHRICNDCMKSCIYQKQDPVDIPQAETRILTDVLALPYGVEIYDLLTRWNPLRQKQYLPCPYNGLKVLIAGQGPAGFTLAHHLLMEGFAVVGVDGLKIEPLPIEFLTQPIRDYAQLQEPLAERIMAGFGGVAEYGITVRWDKNFLKLIYLSLLRRTHYQVFGSVRFGGTLTIADVWALGFDHLAIAVGAGLPQALAIPNSLAIGMRQANDFLMTLQLTGAAKLNSLANLQIRLPAVVIGGGLTGADTATEVQAYYLLQIEKTLFRYEILSEQWGESSLRQGLDTKSLEILDEFLSHARAVRAEKIRAQQAGTPPDLRQLLHRWGGVTIAYRRSLQASPAYIRNHEELNKALAEGIFYVENAEPDHAHLDAEGHLTAIQFKRDGAVICLSARSVFIATGARPNVAYAFEHQGELERDGFQYRLYTRQQDTLQQTDVKPAHCKVSDFGAFTSYQQDGRCVSLVGDTHPVFHGSVVKAIASAQKIYPQIVASFAERVQQIGDERAYQTFRAYLYDQLQAIVVKVEHRCQQTLALTVRAPLAARRYQAGQFFRVQNYESLAPVIAGTRLHMEALALFASQVQPDSGEIEFLIQKIGTSARLVATFQAGQPLAVMGPTGVRTRIGDGNETVLIIAEQAGIVNSCMVGRAMRQAGNRVVCFAHFSSATDIYCQTELEAAADVIVWVTDSTAPLTNGRPQDLHFVDSMLDALSRYAQTVQPIPLSVVNRVLVLGSPALLRAVQNARCGAFRDYFVDKTDFTGAVYSTMQCMLKGVCAQCLQWQIDPVTGMRTKAVFACSWQEQPLEWIDIDNLNARLQQNTLQEYLSNRWLDYLLQTER
ncbi:FAD-dependent oxidoreductase [Beggiatoa leptomitoformis]|uniref:Pyridine nucleotide-disulfide oxidoreductase n=1 Tax=Beggiatoa leptomitoformis TaxID=288004 RepID=A0A2N9YDW5_9GAMM|nr:FAD-dependent oxidoreductase [Beggiatoa leptomitoformis]ALG68948.1 pyridine nucleotide-disulfide oxidoreductase [Beggiatoa leptomitoformis]AUI68664.1 pyridine nucleotide-disulfide oxidoreductase [Beggiatoa leptomitoformis]